MKNTNNRSRTLALSLLLAGGPLLMGDAGAWEIHSSEQSKLNASLDAGLGLFATQRSYQAAQDGATHWQEGYLKLGLDGEHSLAGQGRAYGGASILSTATWGDGDAAGFSLGGEQDTELETLYAGWKSGNLWPVLGEDGLDVSIGRQGLVIGDGFVIDDDIYDLGAGLGDEFDRGGAYYLAPRSAFARTAVLRLGGDSGLRADLAWVQSDNRAQGNTRFALLNVEHAGAAGRYGFMYLRGLDVRDSAMFAYQSERDGMNLYNLRASSRLGTEDLEFSAGYVYEDKQHAASAGYVQADYSLAGLPWQPVITYRYSQFSRDYDAMFYGFNDKSGAWLQGDVAGSYAGPFNSNAAVQHLGINLQPGDGLAAGALLYDFRTLDTRYGNSSGREADLYLSWTFAEHYSLMPLVGYYQPASSASGATEGSRRSGWDAVLTFTLAF